MCIRDRRRPAPDGPGPHRRSAGEPDQKRRRGHERRRGSAPRRRTVAGRRPRAHRRGQRAGSARRAGRGDFRSVRHHPSAGNRAGSGHLETDPRGARRLADLRERVTGWRAVHRGHPPNGADDMSNERILVVDDEKLLRWSLRERLVREGFDVTEAETGRDARDRIAEDTVDLVLLDYRLPDTNGLDLLKTILAAQPEVPVILMTAYSTVETAVEAILSLIHISEP